MADVYKTISNVEVRLQWSGQWNAFHTNPAPGFPGVLIPLELARIARSMEGLVIKADNDNYTTTAEVAVLQLFESLTGTEGPGNFRWTLRGDTDFWTTIDKLHWLPGQNAVAFQVGRQALDGAGNVDPNAAKQPYNDSYPFSAIQVGNANYWMCFELT